MSLGGLGQISKHMPVVMKQGNSKKNKRKEFKENYTLFYLPTDIMQYNTLQYSTIYTIQYKVLLAILYSTIHIHCILFDS